MRRVECKRRRCCQSKRPWSDEILHACNSCWEKERKNVTQSRIVTLVVVYYVSDIGLKSGTEI